MNKLKCILIVYLTHCPIRSTIYFEVTNIMKRATLPSGLYWAMMVTVCPALFSAAAACSWVALRRFTPFTWDNTMVTD